MFRGFYRLLVGPEQESAEGGVAVDRMTEDLIRDAVLRPQHRPYAVALLQMHDDAVGRFLRAVRERERYQLKSQEGCRCQLDAHLRHLAGKTLWVLMVRCRR